MVVPDMLHLHQVMISTRVDRSLMNDIIRRLGKDKKADVDGRIYVRLRRNAAGNMTAIHVQRSGALAVALSWDRKSATLRSDAGLPLPDYKVIRGEVDRISFYSSAVSAGMHDRLIPAFAAAFAHDVDFQREIAPGDIFEAVYATREDLQESQLLYASLTTRDRAINLYRYRRASAQEPEWFDGNGASVARPLLRTPVDGARVSSSFGPRFHPVLRYTRLHKGVDFAVPIGTQVYASGDGTVILAGGVRGYGNYLRIRHADGRQTAYAHLSRFGPAIVPGTTVRQGQVVALSGNSGLSSGPHLHYEVYSQGIAIDPMLLTRNGTSALPPAEQQGFRRERDRIDRLRRTTASVSTATD